MINRWNLYYGLEGFVRAKLSPKITCPSENNENFKIQDYTLWTYKSSFKVAVCTLRYLNLTPKSSKSLSSRRFYHLFWRCNTQMARGYGLQSRFKSWNKLLLKFVAFCAEYFYLHSEKRNFADAPNGHIVKHITVFHSKHLMYYTLFSWNIWKLFFLSHKQIGSFFYFLLNIAIRCARICYVQWPTAWQ